MLMGNSLIEPTTSYYHIFYIDGVHAQAFIRYIDCSILYGHRVVREHVSPLPVRDPLLISQVATTEYSRISAEFFYQSKRSLHLGCVLCRERIDGRRGSTCAPTV